MKWQVEGEPAERGYQFSYDGIGRLSKALYGEGKGIVLNNKYDELIDYDKVGNITTLQRYGKSDNGFGLIDNLSYVYNNNQLMKVTDTADSSVTYYSAFHFVDGADAETEYVYDANGNMTQDFNKKISKIEYNSLNLPSMIQYSHGDQAHYGYDAVGRKLSVSHIISPVNIYVPMGSTTLPENAFLEWRGFDVYADNIQYFMEKSLSVFPTRLNFDGGYPTRLNFDGGYITSIDDTPVYHYYLQDHLGNNRMVVNANGEVEQVNHYYAFGGLMGESTGGDTQTYKYNGKELDRINGLDWYDYGARNYDAALGRWHVVDPLAEKYYNVSPYAYCNNNPIRFIDPDGRKLLFASGTTEAFKQKFRAAIMYLHEHNADGIIAQIDKSSTIIYITERVGEPSAFSETKKTIYWDPNMGVLTSSDKKMSPTAVLNHEADHTLQYLKNPDKYAQDSKTFDPDYDNKEEMRVITGSEQKTALALDEISAGEVTRTDHYGIPYITKSPTTTEAKDGKMPKNPFIMDEIVISAPKSKM